MYYYIGIDLGTSACKLLLVEETGAIINSVTKEYPLSFPHPGWSEQKAEDWWDAVVTGVPELLRGFDANDVAGIGSGGPVSYTHLDVYKRQAVTSAVTPRRGLKGKL